MQSKVADGGPQQRLGRRLGLDPYYQIVEQSADRLRLESRSEANRGPGRRILALGIALLAAAALVLLSGLYAGGSGVGFAAAAFGAAIGGLLGAFGYQRALGGYAVITTYNRIVADAAERAVIFTQGNRVAPERTQRLGFEQIQALRLRRRPLAIGAARAVRPVVALELVTEGGEIWVVDSAGDPELLRCATEGLSKVLGMPLSGA